jgi:MFS family permease
VRGLRQTIGDAMRSLRDVFRNRALRRIQLAFAASIIGDWAYAVAVAVYAYDHGGATAVGVLGVVRYLSLAIVTPFGAVLGDRYRRRLVMVGCDLTRAVLVFAAAALIAGGGAELAVYALSILAAIAGAPFRSAQAALLPELAEGPAELSAANVASSTIESVGFFAGPALAGILLAVTTIPVVYALNGATFLVSAALVLGVHEARRSPKAAAAPDTDTETATTGEGFFREASAGYREILGSRDLRLLIGLYCAQTVIGGASLVFNVAIALELLDIGRSGLGFLDSVLGIGGIVGGFLALILAQRGRLARDFGVGVLLWSTPLLLVAIWPTLAAAAAAMIILGVANSVVDVNAYTIVQRLAPEQSMARVFGAMESALIGGMALGALLMPLLIATVGLRWGLAAIGIAVSCCVVAGAAALRRIDRLALAPPGLGLLRGVPLLSLLPEPTLERLARKLIRVEAAGGEIVIRQGDAGDRFYVIESGELEVSKDGRFVATLGPGDFAGEIALLRDVPRTATVKATCPTVLQALERTVFIPAVTGQGAFGEAADAAIATRLSML